MYIYIYIHMPIYICIHMSIYIAQAISCDAPSFGAGPASAHRCAGWWSQAAERLMDGMGLPMGTGLPSGYLELTTMVIYYYMVISNYMVTDNYGDFRTVVMIDDKQLG